MDRNLTEEEGRRLRRQAREAIDADRRAPVDRWTREAVASPHLALLAQLEQRLDALDQGWAIHRRPLRSRIPLLGRIASWLAARLHPFLLQHQIEFNAETAHTLRQIYNLQQILVRDLVERGDDLFFRLDERLLALEARIRDLEAEVENLRRDR